MKKILMMVLILLLLVGCGSNNVNNALENANDIQSVDVGGDTTEIKTESGVEVTVATDEDKSIDIPEDYPKDKLPVYKGARVTATQTNPDGTILLIALSDAKMDEIVEFYEGVLEGAEVLMKQNADGSYLNMGELDGMTYSVAVGEDTVEGNLETSITLMAMPMSLIDESAVVDTESDDEVTDMAPAEFKVPDNIIWPEAYPSEIIPEYDLAYTEVKDVISANNENVVMLMTEDKIADVKEYYEEKLKDAENYVSMDIQGGVNIAGTIDDLYIMVMLFENNGMEEKRFKTLIQIVYY